MLLKAVSLAVVSPILISDVQYLYRTGNAYRYYIGLAAFHSVASKIYTNFKMHQSSLQPEKMILVHLLDGVPPLNAKPTLTLTPPSVTEFSPGLLHSAFSGQTAYRARKLSHQFAHSAKPDRVFRLFSHCIHCTMAPLYKTRTGSNTAASSRAPWRHIVRRPFPRARELLSLGFHKLGWTTN